MGNQRQTKTYLIKEKKECPKCHHHGRDVKMRSVMDNRIKKMVMKVRCNNCTMSAF